jgi:hypothetical protein
MIYPLILIIFFSLFSFHCIKVMIKKGDDLHALSFLLLFIYTIFVQIGYVFFPQLFISVGTYFGPEIFYQYWIFIFLSFLLSYLIYLKINNLNRKKLAYFVIDSNRFIGKSFFMIFSVLLYFVLIIYFFKNKDEFGWGDGNPMGSQFFALGFGFYTICMLIIYIFYRNKIETILFRRLSLILFLFFLIFFLRVCFASGLRSNILYFFLAIIFYEFSPFNNLIKFQKKKIFLVLIIFPILINSLMTISSLRGNDTEINFATFFDYKDTSTEVVDLSEKIIVQDYFAPSQLLFVSIYYNIVDPIETFKSNFFNTFIFFDYPYLTQKITSKLGNNFTRGQGWGYYFFVEGYNAIGWFGFLYNAIFWNLGMSLWTALARSNDKLHNRAFFSILVLFIGNQMRSGQTCNFVHSYWLFLLPALGLLLIANHKRIILNKY